MFFKAIKYIGDWGDMSRKKIPNWSFFAEIMSGGSGRFKINNLTIFEYLDIFCVCCYIIVKSFAKKARNMQNSTV